MSEKFVLIMTDQNDLSTCDVIDWLRYYNCKVIVLTEKDTINIISIFEDGEFLFTIGTSEYHSEQIKSFWYRRGYLNLKHEYNFDLNDNLLSQDTNNCIELFIKSESNDIKNYVIYYLLHLSVNISSQFTSRVNKIIVNCEAVKIGLNVPRQIITSSLEELGNFISKTGRVITKTINNHFSFTENNYIVSSYTEEINKNILSEHNKNFFLSNFQELVQKKFEVRVFYLENVFYSMAIFSQSNKKTLIDFRKYDFVKPNRTVPFLLPDHIKVQLRKLLERFRLNTASIDLIYGEDGKFYFLEINPIGQFGMTSEPCNYYLEKIIANHLNYIDNEKPN